MIKSLAWAVLALTPPAVAQDPFLELFEVPGSTPIDDQDGEVRTVWLDDTQQPEQIHVLSRSAHLGTFEVSPQAVVAVASPRVGLPGGLGPRTSWVVSRSSIGSARIHEPPAGLRTTYRSFFPPGNAAERAGAAIVSASGDGSTLLFLQGGSHHSSPSTLEVIEGSGSTRFVLQQADLARFDVSFDGSRLVVLAQGKLDLYVGPSPMSALELGGSGSFHLSPDGHWLSRRVPGQVEVHDLDISAMVSIPVTEPVMALAFDGDHVAVVERSQARLFVLGSPTPTAVVTVPVTPGYRFSSVALSPRDPDGTPWMALGELRVLAAPSALPNAPPPRGAVVIRAFDQGAEVERWEFGIRNWRGTTPAVQWTAAGRLIASTKRRVWASKAVYP